jgi:GNAT superfamily N-acetyltransferase
VNIRRARPGDAFAIRTLLGDLGYAPDPRAAAETVTQVIRHPEACVFVAAEGQDVLGYIAVSYRPQIRLGGLLASIDELVVARVHVGRGIGTQLLDAALSHARGLRCRRIELHQNRQRESYRRGFYLRRGFVEVNSAVLRLELS